jgi:predicted nucleic acid-binding Zn ribbon protein
MSFRHVGRELQGLLSEWLENPESRSLVLDRTWERAVGDAVSRRCRPLTLEDSVLTVEVTDSAWKHQLEAMSADLIKKMNMAVGKPSVRRIVWVLDGEVQG